MKVVNNGLTIVVDGALGHFPEKFVVSALEKQIPKKPVKARREIVCPTCKTLVGSSPYCRYCGQALDWGDSE